MQRQGLLLLLGLLVLALTAASAVAGTVSLNQTDQLTVTVLDTDALTLNSFAYGIGVGSITQGPDSSSVSGNPANAAIPSGPYLVNTQATTSARKSTVTMNQNMLAVAPDAVFGYTSQETTNDALFTFKASDSGLFAALITNAYNQAFNVTNPAGFAAFTSIFADSNLTATLTDTRTGNLTQTIINLLSFPVDNQGVPLEDVSGQVAQSNPFAMVLDGVLCGDLLTLDLYLDSTINGGSDGNGPSEVVVPLPSSLLLLVSGLAGLFLARRWNYA